jgi:hypothetical protein
MTIKTVAVGEVHGQSVEVDRLRGLAEGSLHVGVIGRRTELVLIPSGQGRMRIISPHELPVDDA